MEPATATAPDAFPFASASELELAVASVERGGRNTTTTYSFRATVSAARSHGRLRFLDLVVLRLGAALSLTEVQLIARVEKDERTLERTLKYPQLDRRIAPGAVVRVERGEFGRSKTGRASVYVDGAEQLQLLLPAPPRLSVAARVAAGGKGRGARGARPNSKPASAKKLSGKQSGRTSARKRQKVARQRQAGEIVARLFADGLNSGRFEASEGLCRPCGEPAPAAIDWARVPPSLDPAGGGGALTYGAHTGAIKAGGASTGGASGRAQRKRQQVESVFAALLPLLLELRRQQARRGDASSTVPAPLRIVDFGSGSGNATLAIAWALHQRGLRCTWLLLDAKERAVALAAERVAAAGLELVVEARAGKIEELCEPFDAGVAVHACGVATDLAQLQCLRAAAPFVLVPCCVGKIARDGLLPALSVAPAAARGAGGAGAAATAATGDTAKRGRDFERGAAREHEHGMTAVRPLGEAAPRSRWLREQVEITILKDPSRCDSLSDPPCC